MYFIEFGRQSCGKKIYLDASELEGNRVEKKYLDASELEGPFPVSYTHLTLPTIYPV